MQTTARSFSYPYENKNDPNLENKNIYADSRGKSTASVHSAQVR